MMTRPRPVRCTHCGNEYELELGSGCPGCGGATWVSARIASVLATAEYADRAEARARL